MQLFRIRFFHLRELFFLCFQPGDFFLHTLHTGGKLFLPFLYLCDTRSYRHLIFIQLLFFFFQLTFLFFQFRRLLLKLAFCCIQLFFLYLQLCLSIRQFFLLCGKLLFSRSKLLRFLLQLLFSGSQFFLLCSKLILPILQFCLFFCQKGFIFLQFFFLFSDSIFGLFDLRSAVFQRLFSVRQFLFTVFYLFSGIGKLVFPFLINRIISSLTCFLFQLFYPVLYLFYSPFVRGTVTFQLLCPIHLHIDFCINLTGKRLRKQQPKTVNTAVSDTSRSTGQFHIIG